MNRKKTLIFLITTWVLLLWLTASSAQSLTFSELKGPFNGNTWQLTFSAKGNWRYQAILSTKQPRQLIINFSSITQFNNTVNSSLFSNSPLISLYTQTINTGETNQLQVIFNLKTAVNLSATTINGVPNRLIITLVDPNLHSLSVTKPLSQSDLSSHVQPHLSSDSSSIKRSSTSTPYSIPAGQIVPATYFLQTKTKSSQSSHITIQRSKKEQSSPKSIRQSIRRIIIVIDPGHGGKDPGATGIDGIHEKNIVLCISKKLQTLINQQPGFYAVLTRSGDYFIPLRQRMLIARQNHADMFIAIHADTYLNHVAHGASVYALSSRGATSEAARWLAQHENQSELIGGVNLTDKEDMLRSVLINLSQTATIHASLLIGQNLLTEFNHYGTPLHHARVEQAAFVVLKSPDIPSLLVETGFLSNKTEEYHLQESAYQQKIADALMLGIVQYFTRNPPPGTWLAEKRDLQFTAAKNINQTHPVKE